MASGFKLIPLQDDYISQRGISGRAVSRGFQKMNGSLHSKTSFAVVLFIAVSLLTETLACAGEKNTKAYAVLKFTAGVATAFMIHEGAHALAATITDTDIDWEWGDINQPITYTEHAENDEKGLIISSSGLLSQALGSEIILRHDKINKNDAFVRGMMAWNILNPLSYAMDYWMIHRTNKRQGGTYNGDLEGVEYYSDKSTADAFAATMLAVAASQGYRFLKTQTWAPEWLKEKGRRVCIVPLRSGGGIIAYRQTF